MSNTVIIQITGSILLAIVPALVWTYIFHNKLPGNRRLTLLTFFVGATAVFPILFYKYLWQYFPWLNAFKYAEGFESDIVGFTRVISIPASVLITFLIVGIIEEAMKNVAVRIVDDKDTTKDIDDAIEMSIVAALGFAFTENIMYFHAIWMQQGPENLMLPFVFRTIFSTFAHVMFSAIFGYYYGISFFAKGYLIDNRRTIKWPKTLQNIFGIQKEEIFSISKWVEGFLIATILHAIYNIFLEMNWTFLLVPFLGLGYVYVNHLLRKKENHKRLGQIEQQQEERKPAEEMSLVEGNNS